MSKAPHNRKRRAVTKAMRARLLPQFLPCSEGAKAFTRAAWQWACEVDGGDLPKVGQRDLT